MEQPSTRVIDLRSDTVTRPTPEMRRAMAEAEVGDDVFGDDPTVARLQARVASLLGKPAALFVPSGTMANELALRAWTEPGDEVIVERSSHIFNYEGGAAAALSGVQLLPLEGKRGVLTAEQIEEAIRPADHHYPRTRVVALENTHNRAGGTIYPLAEIERVAAVCARHGLKLHLDGARLWNASVATGIPPAQYAAPFDSVAVCLSKGLGCPIGSLVAGPVDFIERVHRFRKQWGGGMRQVGIVAAAGLYALDHHIERLKEDHANAKLLARGLKEVPGIGIRLEDVETNMVFFEVPRARVSAQGVVAALAEQGVLMLATSPSRIRAVTHLDVTAADIERAIGIVQRTLRGLLG
ncbi:MAG TPA: low-specificity L-threonine aldolase [Thermodesulfobacteriota bacterium]|nr:low-specificity L-threonine aldolase [Thermodesulfobacteriota bacterium]